MMKKQAWTNPELIEENALLKQKIQELEQSKSERKRAEEALRKSEEKYRLLIENSHDIIYMLTPDGVFTFVSPGWTTLLGHPVNQVVGKPFQPLVHPDDIGRCEIFLQKVIETGQPQTGVEYRVRHADGYWRWHTTNAVPLRDEAGTVVGFEGIASDITDRKRAEDALRESEEQYRLVVENAGEAIVIDQDGMHKFVNRRAIEILGYSKEELTSRPFIEFVHPDDREMVLERYLKRMKGEDAPNIYPLKIIAEDSTVKWIEIHPTLISWNGKPATLNFFMDITDRKRSEEALRASELRYQTIFETTGTTMLIVEEDMTISLANDGFESLTGYKREETEGKRKWTEFVEKSDLAEMVIQHQLRRKDSGLGKRGYEFRLVHRDGHMRNIFLTVDIIPGTKRSVASLMDITNRKQAEEALWESEKKYRQLFMNAPAAIYEVDYRNRCFISLNEIIPTLTGYSREELMQMDPWELFTEESRKTYLDRIRLMKEGMDVSASQEYEIRKKDGGILLVNTNINYTIEDGLPVRARIVAHDVTARKQAEEAFLESENKFKNFAEQALAGIYLMQDGIFKYVNPKFAQMFGYTVEECLNDMSFKNLVYTDDLTKVEEQIRRRTSGEVEFVHYAFRGLRKNGQIFHVEIYGSTGVHKGRPAAAGTILDITERKRAEVALKESEEKYNQFFRTSRDCVFITSREGSWIDMNDAAVELFGYSSREELMQAKIQNLYVNPEERTKHGNIITEHGYTKEFPVDLRRKDGKVIHTLITSVARYDAEGNVIGFQGTIRDIAERKQAEEALRKSEERFRTVFENAPYGISVHSLRDGSIVAVNSTFEKISGYSASELLGKNPLELGLLVHTEDYQRLMDVLVQKGRIDNEFLDISICNEEIRHIRFSATSVELHGNPSFITMMVDITDERRTVEALRLSEQKFSDIFNLSPDFMGISHVSDGRLIEVNHGFEEGTGWGRKEAIGRTALELGLWDNPQQRTSAVEKMNKEGRLTNFDLVYRRKTGSKRHGLISMTPIRIQSNDCLCFAVRDITDRKRAEEECMRLATALEQAAEGIIISDTNLIIRYVNPAFELISGYSKSEIIGQHPRILKSDKHDRAFYKIIRDTLARGEVWSGRITPKKKDGSFYDVDVTASPVRDRSDTIINYVTIYRDISHEVRLEGMLRQTQKMEAIGTLAGGIAHDFNNILSAIIGYTDMALSQPKMDDRQRHYLNQVYKAGGRARDLVKQILAFSRQSDQKPRPLKISPIIKEVLKLLRASLPTSIAIRQDIQSQTDTVLADPTQIHQIVMNLCTNAAHAMRETKGKLKVSLVPMEIKTQDTLNIHHGLNPGMYLKLTVSDTGHGIETAIMERIFDPFFTTKKPGEGTGMGLSVVHGIVKSYHGAITVESDVGKGTEFHVYLPLLNETGENREVGTMANIPGGKERILFVDDEETLVELGKDMLTGMGYEVIGRTSSLEALKLFQARPARFDLVITDMTMPHMTGIELAEEIMRIRPDIPVILCTGFSESITPEKAKSLGLREFIMKPVILSQIAETIRSVLDHED